MPPLQRYEPEPIVAPKRPSSGSKKSNTTMSTGSRKPRKQLPDKAPRARYHPIQPHPDPPSPSPSPSSRKAHRRGGTSKLKHRGSAPMTKTQLPNRSSPASGAQSLPSMAERSAKDEFLVQCKGTGMTYKEIRRKGGFSEAESTLRGRYRTLTKKKEERVRKPEWSAQDVSLPIL